MANRIFVTAMGAVSPIGIGLDDFWSNLVAGKNGAAPMTRIDTDGYRTTFACEVKGFDPLNYLDRKESRRMDLFTQFAMASTAEAVEAAGLDDDSICRDRIGVIFASGIGGMYVLEDQVIKCYLHGPGRVSPLFIPMMIGDIVPGYISMRWNFTGPNYSIQSACASASHAIGLGYMHLKAGDADVIVTGGTEAPLTPSGVAGFCAMHALSTRNDEPEKASRPFDADRDGFVMGEGAGTIVLETEEHAVKRGAPLLAELIGYGFSADAYHLTAPAPGGVGAVKSMSEALRSAGIDHTEVDYINAHGTSTELNDKTETTAIRKVFKDHADKLAVSSSKSMIGHLLGAAGAVETIACIQAVRTDVVPPTINYETPDPNCDLHYVPNKAEEREANVAMSNTFGFGGHNATLVVRKLDL